MSVQIHIKETNKVKGVVTNIQTETLSYLTRYFLKNKFKWLLPVILSPVTDPLWPDPRSSGIKPLSVRIYGNEMKLMHSMILHKQVAIALGLKRVFILSPNIRVEPPEKISTGRHAFEFTQLDFEIENATLDYILRFVEDLFVSLIAHIKKNCVEELEILGRDLRVPRRPFRKYYYTDLVEEHGESWEEIISEENRDPVWVLSIPREFYDREDPQRPGLYRNYDLILPEGFGEVLSGGEREYQWERIKKRMLKDGLKPEDYGLYYDLACKNLLRPSAGAGIGIERLVRFIAGLRHIRDVQLFERIPGIIPKI